MHINRLLMSVIGSLALSCSGLTQIFHESNIFTGTFEGQGNYRIPSIIAAKDGSLIAFAEGRYSGTDPGSVAGRNRIVYRRSTDKGLTWGTQITLPSPTVGDCSNPEAVLDEHTGKLFVFYNKWPSGKGQGAVPPGVGMDSCTIWYRSSSDHGATWSDETNVTASVKDPSWRGAALGPGTGIQLKYSHVGRLMISGQRTLTTDQLGTLDPWVFYSDDHGQTWVKGGLAADVYPVNGDENHVVELTNGTLVIDARQVIGTQRYKFASTDGGTTWTSLGPWHPGITPVSCATVRHSAARDGWKKDRIMFSAPVGSGSPGRSNMTMFVSYDEGSTWPLAKLIYSGSAAYSTMTMLPDGTVGLLYEIDNYASIRFARMDLRFLGESNTETVLHGTVTLQDWVASIEGEPISYRIMSPGTGNVLDSGTVALRPDGSYRVFTRLRGTYDLAIRGRTWLRQKRTGIVVSSSGVAGLDFSLPNGDVDGDNAITVFDYNELSDSFDSVPGDGHWKVSADLDGDLAVTVFDYNILSTNFDLSGD